MSLHATMSPEVRQKISEQKRNSTISSIAIAVISMALIIIILGIIAMTINPMHCSAALASISRASAARRLKNIVFRKAGSKFRRANR